MKVRNPDYANTGLVANTILQLYMIRIKDMSDYHPAYTKISSDDPRKGRIKLPHHHNGCSSDVLR